MADDGLLTTEELLDVLATQMKKCQRDLTNDLAPKDAEGKTHKTFLCHADFACFFASFVGLCEKFKCKCSVWLRSIVLKIK